MESGSAPVQGVAKRGRVEARLVEGNNGISGGVALEIDSGQGGAGLSGGDMVTDDASLQGTFAQSTAVGPVDSKRQRRESPAPPAAAAAQLAAAASASRRSWQLLAAAASGSPPAAGGAAAARPTPSSPLRLEAASGGGRARAGGTPGAAVPPTLGAGGRGSGASSAAGSRRAVALSRAAGAGAGGAPLPSPAGPPVNLSLAGRLERATPVPEGSALVRVVDSPPSLSLDGPWGDLPDPYNDYGPDPMSQAEPAEEGAGGAPTPRRPASTHTTWAGAGAGTSPGEGRTLGDSPTADEGGQAAAPPSEEGAALAALGPLVLPPAPSSLRYWAAQHSASAPCEDGVWVGGSTGSGREDACYMFALFDGHGGHTMTAHGVAELPKLVGAATGREGSVAGVVAGLKTAFEAADRAFLSAVVAPLYAEEKVADFALEAAWAEAGRGGSMDGVRAAEVAFSAAQGARVSAAMAGACAQVVLLRKAAMSDEEDAPRRWCIFTANAGDCRAVLGTSMCVGSGPPDADGVRALARREQEGREGEGEGASGEGTMQPPRPGATLSSSVAPPAALPQGPPLSRLFVSPRSRLALCPRGVEMWPDGCGVPELVVSRPPTDSALHARAIAETAALYVAALVAGGYTGGLRGPCAPATLARAKANAALAALFANVGGRALVEELWGQGGVGGCYEAVRRESDVPAWHDLSPSASTTAATLLNLARARRCLLASSSLLALPLSRDHVPAYPPEYRAVVARSKDAIPLRRHRTLVCQADLGDRDKIVGSLPFRRAGRALTAAEVATLRAGAVPNLPGDALLQGGSARPGVSRIPLRTAGSLAVTRALGDWYLKAGGVGDEGTPYLTVEPEVDWRVIQPGDRLLILACDGVWDVLRPSEAIELAVTAVGEEAAGKALGATGEGAPTMVSLLSALESGAGGEMGSAPPVREACVINPPWAPMTGAKRGAAAEGEAAPPLPLACAADVSVGCPASRLVGTAVLGYGPMHGPSRRVASVGSGRAASSAVFSGRSSARDWEACPSAVEEKYDELAALRLKKGGPDGEKTGTRRNRHDDTTALVIALPSFMMTENAAAEAGMLRGAEERVALAAAQGVGGGLASSAVPVVTLGNSVTCGRDGLILPPLLQGWLEVEAEAAGRAAVGGREVGTPLPGYEPFNGESTHARAEGLLEYVLTQAKATFGARSAVGTLRGLPAWRLQGGGGGGAGAGGSGKGGGGSSRANALLGAARPGAGAGAPLPGPSS